MAQMQILVSSAVLLMFAIRTFTMPLKNSTNSSQDNSTVEQALELSFDFGEPDNTTEANNTGEFQFKLNCYLQKNESGIITTLNMTREEAGTTFIDYEEECELDTKVISWEAYASLAGNTKIPPDKRNTIYKHKNKGKGRIAAHIHKKYIDYFNEPGTDGKGKAICINLIAIHARGAGSYSAFLVSSAVLGNLRNM